jgi:L-ascorbate metabolism protein UlaG (beta-lactamase superfamily)
MSTKHATLVTDPGVSKLGLKIPLGKVNVELATQADFVEPSKEVIVIDSPGEYEVSRLLVHGIAARSHTDEEGKQSVTMYKVMNSEISLLVTGHIHPDLSDDQLEAIGTVDLVVIPVGGNGYTLDAAGAAEVIKKLEPRAVIPTHYKDSRVKYPVPQNDLEPFLKEMATNHEKLPKLKIKNGELPEILTVFELER